jgi:hypothetical protein
MYKKKRRSEQQFWFDFVSWNINDKGGLYIHSFMRLCAFCFFVMVLLRSFEARGIFDEENEPRAQSSGSWKWFIDEHWYDTLSCPHCLNRNFFEYESEKKTKLLCTLKCKYKTFKHF